jgi:hypothetical protein
MSLPQWLSWLEPVFEQPLFNGFLGGLIAGLLVVLLAVLLAALVRQRTRCHMIAVRGENGDLYISSNAVRDMVSRVLYEFGEATLNSVALSERRGSLLLRCDVEVLPDTQLPPLLQSLRTTLMERAGGRLGIDRPLRVDVVVHSLSAKESAIAKGTRRVGVAQTGVPGSPTTPTLPRERIPFAPGDSSDREVEAGNEQEPPT